MAVAAVPFANVFVARDRAVAHGSAFLRIWEVRGNAAPADARRWRLFDELLGADDRECGTLRPAYEEAKHLPGRWIATAPVIEWWQLPAVLLGLPFRSRVPQMAVRWHADLACLDLAPDAESVMPGRTRPRWGDIFSRGFAVEWV